MTRWYRRIAALVTAGVVGALVPVAAWAQTSPTVVAVGDNLARKKVGRAVGAIGVFGTLCCLLVVAVIVLGVVLIVRRRAR